MQIVLLLILAISGCRSTMNDPKSSVLPLPSPDTNKGNIYDENGEIPHVVGPVAPWDPERVMLPGINILTFNEGDTETGFPYYRNDKIYKLKFLIKSDFDTNPGNQLYDPGVYFVTIDYKRQSETTWNQVASHIIVSADETVTFDWNLNALSPFSDYQVKITARSLGNNTFEKISNPVFIVDNSPPTVTAFSLALNKPGVEDAQTINRPYFTSTFQASDAESPVAAYCLKPEDLTVPTTDDSCWIYLPEQQRGLTITIAEAPAFAGIEEIQYNFYLWVRDQAGTISALSNNGSGTNGIDKIQATYRPGRPPVIENLVVSNSNTSLGLSVSDAQNEFIIGDANKGKVYVRWRLVDDNLGAYPVKINYTFDGTNYINAHNQLVDGANQDCAYDTNLHSGCFVFEAPTNDYFNIQIVAQDESGLESSQSWKGSNYGRFSLVTGSVDRGINGSAKNYFLLQRYGGTSNVINSNTIAVSKRGVIFVLDERLGVIKISPEDGMARQFIKRGPTATGDGGPVSNATLLEPVKITLDYQDRLLILDRNRIRRVEAPETENPVIQTFIGGAVSTPSKPCYDPSRGMPALEFCFPASVTDYLGSTLIALPNGNIWFSIANLFDQQYRNFRMGMYRADINQVFIFTLNGAGAQYQSTNHSGLGLSTNPTTVNHEQSNTDLNVTIMSNLGLIFNPANSQPEVITMRFREFFTQNHRYFSANFNPRSGLNAGLGPHFRFLSWWGSNTYVTSRSGELYSSSAHTNSGIYKINKTTRAWERVLGTGTLGQCPDGTIGTACNIDVRGFWVTQDGLIYFIDQNRIRVMNKQGVVNTLYGESNVLSAPVLPHQARYIRVQSFGLWGAENKVIVNDIVGYQLREVTTEGSPSVVNLSGDGSYRRPAFITASGENYSNTLASASPFISDHWSHDTGIMVDRNNGDVYSNYATSILYRLNRGGSLADRWQRVIGGGSNSLVTTAANNKLGNEIAQSGNYPSVLRGLAQPPAGVSEVANGAIEEGNANSFILISNHTSSGNCGYVNRFMRQFQLTDGASRYVMGSTGIHSPCDTLNMPLGNVNGFDRFHPFSSQVVGAHYDPSNRSWLMSFFNAKEIVSVPLVRDGSDKVLNGGVSTRLTTTVNNIASFAHKKECNQDAIYYCATNGKLYRKLAHQLVEEELVIPNTPGTTTPFFTCAGRYMHLDWQKEHFYFIFSKDGLQGIAKYKLTTPVCN